MDYGILRLMLPAFCECLVLVGIHSYLGVHVIKRKVLFVDLALAQIAALGMLIALFFGITPHTPAAYGFSLVLTAVAAGVFALTSVPSARIPQEAVIGLVYAVAAATSILLIDRAPHGGEHIKEVLTGAILWVRWRTVGIAALVYSLVGLLHYAARRKFVLITDHPDRAWASGIRVRFWDFLFYLSFGVVITLSVDTAGVLLVFVFLVAPAIIAILLTDRWFHQLVIGWSLGLLVTVSGLATSYAADLPTGPTIVAAYAAALLIITGVLYVRRAEDRRRAMLTTAAVVAAALGIFLAIRIAGAALGGRHAAHPAGPHRQDAAPSAPAESPGDEAISPRSPMEEAERISDLLVRDRAEGVRAAIRFLESDPPIFFREEVARALAATLGQEFAPDGKLPMSDPVNRAVLERLKKAAEGSAP